MATFSRQPLKTALSSKKLIENCLNSAKALGMEVEDLGAGSPVLIHRGGKKVISIITGQHGNERSGPIFVMNLLRAWASKKEKIPPFTFIIVPLVNDNGWDKHRRLWHGKNTNMVFSEKLKVCCPATVNIMKILKREHPTLLWDIHEDNRMKTPYIFDYKQDKTDFNKRLAAHVGTRTFEWSKQDNSSE